MATAFPFASYKLNDTTRLSDDHVMSREKMDDGTPVVQVLGSSTYRTIRCEVVPTTISEAQSLLDYLHANKATKFEMTDSATLGGSSYVGYIWSDISLEHSSGVLARASFDFYGKRT